jgi:hypothetical protein
MLSFICHVWETSWYINCNVHTRRMFYWFFWYINDYLIITIDLETQQPLVDMYFELFFAFAMLKTTLINWKKFSMYCKRIMYEKTFNLFFKWKITNIGYSWKLMGNINYMSFFHVWSYIECILNKCASNVFLFFHTWTIIL